MARQAEIKATISDLRERERPTSPRKLVHLMAKMLDEIRRKSKPAWRSNMVDMNYDKYHEDAPADLYDDKYSRR
uniref:Uncharacterized protein n=1 Tax=Romanomermis culicivorax TaxID=13658 RepID=A0A915J9Y6_ROMCU